MLMNVIYRFVHRWSREYRISAGRKFIILLLSTAIFTLDTVLLVPRVDDVILQFNHLFGYSIHVFTSVFNFTKTLSNSFLI